MKFLLLPFSLFLIIFSNGCKRPDDQVCDTATMCIKNYEQDLVVIYRWNGGLEWDTIFPGECATYTINDLKVEYALDGSIISKSTSIVYFETSSATYAYEFLECEMEINAPGGFVNLTENCDNGEYNPETGELDTDCGGFCTPCGAPNLACTIQDDFIDWNIIGLIDEPLNSSNVNYGFKTELNFDFSNSRLKATINETQLPQGTKRYEVGVLDHQIILSYTVGSFSNYEADPGQSVYVVKEANGEYTLKYCDLTFSEGSTSFSGSANLSLTK